MSHLLLLGLVLSARGADLASAVDRAMAGRPGTAIVADVATGRVLASYRPDRASSRMIAGSQSSKDWRERSSSAALNWQRPRECEWPARQARAWGTHGSRDSRRPPWWWCFSTKGGEDRTRRQSPLRSSARSERTARDFVNSAAGLE